MKKLKCRFCDYRVDVDASGLAENKPDLTSSHDPFVKLKYHIQMAHHREWKKIQEYLK